ncbi:hypothetical protein RQP46_003660 [Phenoliferia psychrophenolica]
MLFLTCATLGCIAAALSAPIPSPQAEGIVPYVPCSGDAYEIGVCNSIVNGDVIHTGDEFGQHVGAQSSIAATTVSNILTDEGVDGSAIAGLGNEVDSVTINGLKERSNPLNAALTSVDTVLNANAPAVDENIIPGESKELADAGTGIAQVGEEADAQFTRFANGYVGHGQESIDALAPPKV